MTQDRKPSRAGWLWLVLIFTPATVIIAGLIGLFVWQSRTGTITPKWRKPPPAAVTPTNAPAPAAAAPRPDAAQKIPPP